MERPWPEAGRELERIGAHICEILPRLHRCVAYCDEGVQLRLFIPERAVRFYVNLHGDIQHYAIEDPTTGALVDIEAILERLRIFAPLLPEVMINYHTEHKTTHLNISLRTRSVWDCST